MGKFAAPAPILLDRARRPWLAQHRLWVWLAAARIIFRWYGRIDMVTYLFQGSGQRGSSIGSCDRRYCNERSIASSDRRGWVGNCNRHPAHEGTPAVFRSYPMRVVWKASRCRATSQSTVDHAQSRCAMVEPLHRRRYTTIDGLRLDMSAVAAGPWTQSACFNQAMACSRGRRISR